jgi:predicted metal-binding protein
MAQPPLLFVCTTCARDVPAAGPTRGRQLADALRAASADAALTIREVACLNGCRSPCNVALRGLRRWTYRFSRCTLDDIEALLAVARAYWAAADGELGEGALPPGLAKRMTARTAPPG